MKRFFEKNLPFSPIKWLILGLAVVGTIVAGWFLPARLYVGGAMVIWVVSAFLLIRSFVLLARKDSDIPMGLTLVSAGACLLSSFALVEKGFMYSFLHEPLIPFWEIGVILGLAVGIFVMVKWGRKGTKWYGMLGGILGLALATAVFVIVFASHLNFLLDFSQPMAQTARIEEKERHRHTKSADTYSFALTVDGETFDLDVDYVEYEKYEKGDIYTFEKYRGAFGKPFYISD